MYEFIKNLDKIYEKVFLLFIIILATIAIIVGYKLTKPNLTLYPKLNGENVELYLLKKKFNFGLVNEVKNEPFANMSITDGKNSKSAIVSVAKMNLDQKNCNKKWDCPVLKMSKQSFFLKFNSKSKDKSFQEKIKDMDISKQIK